MLPLHHAIRGLRKAPALTAIAIASLALGIGANVTVYSVAREMILDDASATRPDRLAYVGADITYAEYRNLRDSGLFSGVAFDNGFHDVLWQRGTTDEIAWEMQTSANFFDVLGVRPAIGRLYAQTDEGRLVAVVSYGFWSRRMHGERTIEINGRVYSVAGVLPRDYRSILRHGVVPEIYAPQGPGASRRYGPFVRLADGMTRAQARQALAAAIPSLGIPAFSRELPPIRPFSGFAANAATEGDDRRMFLFFVALLAVAGILALIACANVAGLLLARRMSRHRERAIRQALGANRWQLAQPLLAEAVLLVGGGTALALALDAWLRDRLGYVRWPTAYNIPFEFHFQTDRGLFLYALLTASAALLLCSIGGTDDRRLAAAIIPDSRRWARRYGFVAFQVMLSMVLLTIAALFGRSFFHLATGDVGFDAAHILIAAVHPPPGDHRGEQGWPWRDHLAERVRRIPGVLSVTSTGLLPLMGEVPEAPVRHEGEPPDRARKAYTMGAGEDYFAAMSIPILRGRDFTIADRYRQPGPAIVNRTFTVRFFGSREPLGALMRIGDRPVQIVGVAADSKMRTLGEAPAPAIYTPDYNAQFLVRVAGHPAQWIEPLRRALAQPEGALDVRPLHDAVAGALFPMQAAAGFVGSIGAIGLLLALVGIYGSVSYAVSRRTREMGIRSALGATRARIVWTALREGALALLLGTGIGLVFAISAVRPLRDLMPDGIDALDPRLFAAAAVALIAIGLLAAALPARRAAKVDPAVALRDE